MERSDAAALVLAVATVTGPRVLLYREARAAGIRAQYEATHPPTNHGAVNGVPSAVQQQPPPPPPHTTTGYAGNAKMSDFSTEGADALIRSMSEAADREN